jgi:hypothetical protein
LAFFIVSFSRLQNQREVVTHHCGKASPESPFSFDGRRADCTRPEKELDPRECADFLNGPNLPPCKTDPSPPSSRKRPRSWQRLWDQICPDNSREETAKRDFGDVAATARPLIVIIPFESGSVRITFHRSGLRRSLSVGF